MSAPVLLGGQADQGEKQKVGFGRPAERYVSGWVTRRRDTHLR